ncbi:MAG: SDR family NAD(P)-dependent oxidoreductase [Clostridiales bacterium]|nr:SDR family NAD(P)-dependent oxidoreductase [Clostridiales bacterium]
MKYTKEDLAFFKNKRALQHTTAQSVQGKLCVISGATSGVGLEAAQVLAKGGADLVLVARNREKAAQLKARLEHEHHVAISTVIADFCRLEDVREAALNIRDRHPVIDVLINSAGLYCTQRHLTADGNELVFQVNHLASFLLTCLLTDNLIRSPQGRIIQVNSEGHRFGGLRIDDLDWRKRIYIGLRAYGASKTAQLMTVRTLVERLAGTAVTINAMHPGGVRTGIGSNNGILYRAWQRAVIWPFLKDAAISGNALYYLAAAPELRGATGRYFNLTIDEKPMPHVLDDALRDAVWQRSLELAGLPESF